MGGKVLEYEAKDILRKGEANGMKKAKMQLAAKLLQSGSTIQYVADLTELPEETIRELAQNITSKKNL